MTGSTKKSSVRAVGTRQDVSHRLREMASKTAPNGKLPTTRELCRLLQTTPATLIEALNDLELQNVVYRKPRFGVFVSRRIHQKTVAIIAGSHFFQTDGASPFWDNLWGQFIREAQRREVANEQAFQLFVTSTSPLTDEGGPNPLLIRLLEKRQIDGVLAIGMRYEVIDVIRQYDVPIVSFAVPGDWIVGQDTDQMIRAGVDVLLSEGCRHLCLWDPIPYPPIDSRDELVRHYHIDREHGEQVFLGHVNTRADSVESANAIDMLSLGIDCKPPQQQGYEAAMRLLASPNGARRPDGILVMSDMMTLGLLRAMSELSIKPDIDLKIVSHANKGLPTLYLAEESITQIQFDPKLIVETMYHVLDGVFAGNMPEGMHINIGHSDIVPPMRP